MLLPTIQVCVSVNGEEESLVIRTLKSLLNQSYPDFHLTLLDNSKKRLWDMPEFRACVQSFPRWFYNIGTGRGPSDYNKLLYFSKDDFLFFCPVGLELSPNYLQTLYNANVDIVTSKKQGLKPLLIKKQSLKLESGFDFKYEAVSPYFIDDVLDKTCVIFELDEVTTHISFNTFLEYKSENDEIRLKRKRESSYFKKHILYLDGGLGDHVCAIPLIRAFRRKFGTIVICCSHPEILVPIFKDVEFLEWSDELYGGLGPRIYSYGEENNSSTLWNAACEMYGLEYNEEDFYYTLENDLSETRNKFQNKNIVVIAPSAAYINNQRSNKEWIDTRWMEVVEYLHTLGYYTVQFWREGENRIPNVSETIINPSISQITDTLSYCDFWIGLDSFIHHFGACLGKKGICLHFGNNTHAKHDFVEYIEHKLPDNRYNNKWFLDLQQPERAEAMRLISAQEVKEKINTLVEPWRLIAPLTTPYLVNAQNDAMQLPTEINALQSLVAQSAPEVIVEIGTASGGTLGRWLQIKSAKIVISIDLPNGIHGGQGYDTAKEVTLHSKVEAKNQGKECYRILGDSSVSSTYERLAELLGDRKIDFLFIDGDHTYPRVKNDFLTYSSLVREGGIVAFHDIVLSQWQRNAGAEVDVFWSEICDKFRSQTFFGQKQEAIEKWPMTAPDGFGGIGVIYLDEEVFNEYKFQEEFRNNNSVSIVIGGYNNFEVTKQCIDHIQASLPFNPRISLKEIIVIENGSTEQQREYYKTLNSDLTLVKHFSSPLGFAVTYNRGLEIATGDYIVILNNDCFVQGDWADRLFHQFSRDKKIALVGPTYDREKDYLPGYCWMIRRDVLKKVGLLDRSFGLGYYEDNEFCDRLRHNGFKIFGCEDAGQADESGNRVTTFPIIHLGMGTSRHLPDLEKHIEENKKKYEFYKNYDRNLNFVIITFDGSAISRFLVPLLKLNRKSSFVIVAPLGLNLLVDKSLFINEEEYNIYQNNNYRIHHIETLEESRDALEATGLNFFGKEYKNNTFFIHDRISHSKIDLTWLCLWTDHASMGILSQNLLENFNPRIFDIHAKNIIGTRTTKNPLVLHCLEKESTKKDMGIMFSYPYMANELREYKTKIIYTGSDTSGGMCMDMSRGTDDFGPACNNADILFTPSYLSRDYMLKLGVTKPIFVVPHGIDPSIFSYKERENKKPFTFLYVGELGERKGTFQLLKAWKKAFWNNQDYKLLLVSNKDMEAYWKEELEEELSKFNNVEVRRQNMSQEEIAKVMEESNVLVYPSRADTFGMTILEAQASGLPVIATDQGIGCLDFIEGDFIPVKSYERDVTNHKWMIGKWRECDATDLAKKMKEIVKYDEFGNSTYQFTQSTGAHEISDNVISNFSWPIITRQLESLLRIIHDTKIRKRKIRVLVTSYNRHDYLLKTIESLLKIEKQEVDYEYDIHVLEQSSLREQQEILWDLKNYDVTTHILPCNLGQRGALSRVYELQLLDDCDYVLLSDHDNLFHKPLSLLAKTLNNHELARVTTGYLNTEHIANDIVIDELGTIVKKSTARAGCMMFRQKDLKAMFPIMLDSEYNKPWNSSWNIGIDWYLTYWAPNSPAKKGYQQFVYCVPGLCEHTGAYSSWNGNQGLILDYEVPQDVQEKVKDMRSFAEVEKFAYEHHFSFHAGGVCRIKENNQEMFILGVNEKQNKICGRLYNEELVEKNLDECEFVSLPQEELKKEDKQLRNKYFGFDWL